jgi:hypothetical protein
MSRHYPNHWGRLEKVLLLSECIFMRPSEAIHSLGTNMRMLPSANERHHGISDKQRSSFCCKCAAQFAQRRLRHVLA